MTGRGREADWGKILRNLGNTVMVTDVTDVDGGADARSPITDDGISDGRRWHPR